MYEDKFVQLLKQNVLGYLLIIIIFLGKHMLNVLSLNKAPHVMQSSQSNHAYH